ncbi:MAG: pentapeptide repeat-containing protein [Elainellaceae cyanobacterium]
MPSELTVLTLDQLTDRVQAPVQRDGVQQIDLRRFSIDLRPDSDSSLRQPFYQLIHDRMRQPNSSVGLDLSYSEIQGELDLSQLGDRVPLYSPSLPPVFSDAEQQQLQRDRHRLVQLGRLSQSLLLQPLGDALQISLVRGPINLVQTRVEGAVSLRSTFFQRAISAEGAQFGGSLDLTEARFGQRVNFSDATFRQGVWCRGSIFFGRSLWVQAQFLDNVLFQGSEFKETTSFSRALFRGAVDWKGVSWSNSVDFGQAQWQAPVSFDQGAFAQAVFFPNASFGDRATFREAQFSEPVNLRGAAVRVQLDFGDATFSHQAYLNVSGLEFNAEDAKILGNPGQIGRVLSVPTLQGNETLLRNFVRNFRQLEQFSDANQVEYLTETLRLSLLWQRLVATNLNSASLDELRAVGLTQIQAEAIAQNRERQQFQRVPDLLKLDAIDLTTYVNVSDELVAIAPRTLTSWSLDALHWLTLNGLLVLTRYGTSVGLVFATGFLIVAYFSLVFWLVDRFRKLYPYPVVPTPEETVYMIGSGALLSGVSLGAIFQLSERPWLTLLCLTLLSVPVPVLVLTVLYRRGRYHDLMDSSYFVEDGSARQLRLLIARLPIIPKFPFFRDRFTPILWDRRWNWLNYFDFSLINLIKFGFNDIRLRDEHLPGLISTLVWYQWGLGLLYVVLLLWTLSRTIPGLNLLLYF